jgi:signal transduction histidine kinase
MFVAPAREGGATLVVRVPPDLPIVRADPDRLLQALANLVANALKFAGTGGRVTLSAEHGPAGVRLSVQDTGPGIAADDLPHVFDRYWQKRRAGGKRGTGLGLAIVRGIVEAHGGTINVESTPGAGSEFSFTIPPSN